MGTPPLPAGYALDQSAPPLPSGYKLDTAPTSPPETGVWAGVKRNTVGMVTGLYHAFSDPATEQEKSDLLQKIRSENQKGDNIPESLATNPSRATLAYHRLIDAPADQLELKGHNERAAARDLLNNGQTAKGANLYASGLTDTALSAVPMVGPTINAIAQRYESGDKSGAATDIAALLTPELIKGMAQFAGKATGPVQNALKASATKDYEEILSPTKQTTKYQTNKIMPRLLQERPTAFSRESLAEKAGQQADIAGQEVESKVNQLSGSMNTKPVIDGLQNLKKQYQVNGVSLRPEVDSAIDTVSGQLKQLGPSVSFQDAVKARRILDQAVAEVKGFQGKDLSDSSLASIRKETANSFRSELGKASPDLAAANARFHFWNTLEDVLQQTIERKTGQRPSLGNQIQTAAAGGVGLATGGLTGAAAYGGAMKMLGNAVHSTAWKSMSANLKLNIADAMSSGQYAKIPELLARGGVALKIASPNPAPSQPVDQDKSANE